MRGQVRGRVWVQGCGAERGDASGVPGSGQSRGRRCGSTTARCSSATECTSRSSASCTIGARSTRAPASPTPPPPPRCAAPLPPRRAGAAGRRAAALLAGALDEPQLGGEAEAGDGAETRLHVALGPSGDDPHDVGGVGGEGAEAVERGGRRRARQPVEVVKVLEVGDHHLLLDQSAVEAEEDDAAGGAAVRPRHRLRRQSRQRLPLHRRPERGEREGLRHLDAIAAFWTRAHVLHGDLQPGARGVLLDERRVAVEAGLALGGPIASAVSSCRVWEGRAMRMWAHTG